MSGVRYGTLDPDDVETPAVAVKVIVLLGYQSNHTRFPGQVRNSAVEQENVRSQ